MININYIDSNIEIFSHSSADAGNILRFIEMDIAIISGGVELNAYPVGAVELTSAIFYIVYKRSPSQMKLGRDERGFTLAMDDMNNNVIVTDTIDNHKFISVNLSVFISEVMDALHSASNLLETEGNVRAAYFLKTMFALF